MCNLWYLSDKFGLMKNIDMGQKGPQNTKYFINGHTFFYHNSTIFWPIELKILMGTQETNIYRLLMKNHDFDPFFEKKSYFWQKNG